MAHRSTWLTVFLGAVLMGVGFVSGAPVTFDPNRGLVEVQVQIDGRVTGKFGLDTGADRLYIDREFAKTNGLSFAEGAIPHEVVGIDGADRSTFVSLRSLAIGDDRMYNLSAVAIDLNRLTKGQTGDHPDGLIGFDILRTFYLTIDYPGRSADLYVAEPRFLSGRDYLTVPFRLCKHLIIVDATIDGKVTRPMILDYCASSTVLSTKLANELGLTPRPDGSVTLSSVTLGGVVSQNDVSAVVTDLESYRKSFRDADFEGIIGNSFLWRHKVTIDYKRLRVYFHTAS